MLAEKAGISPFEMRYRNAIRPGQVLPNGQIADDSTALVETLDAVRPLIEANPKAGIACAMKNAGLGVGVPDTGRCRLVVSDGKIHTYTSAACIGQGMATVITQIICEACAECRTSHEQPDTALALNSATPRLRQTGLPAMGRRAALI